MTTHDYLKSLGPLGLASRLKRLSDQTFGEITAFYRAHGIAFDPGCFPLFHLLSQQGALTLSEAAARLGVSHAAISQKVKQLETKGWISMRTGEDQRMRVLEVTEEGRALAARCVPLWQSARETVETLMGEQLGAFLQQVEMLEEAQSSGAFATELQRRAKVRLQQAVKIVPYTEALAPYFEQFNREWIEDYFTLEPLDIWVLGHPQEAILDKGGAIWFALREGEVIGTYALMRLGEGRLEFSKFAVNPAHRGAQAGKKLLEHAIECAQAMGGRELVLYTHSRLETACAMYRKAGFRDVVMSDADRERYRRADTMMVLPLTAIATQHAA
jgi:DNA-binding MarR family transcriptional regulator/GNAT superfamily N-acetyltransferase